MAPKSSSFFRLTEQHITLLSHAYVDWDSAEYGAPSIDPKRPYGSSSVPSSMEKILGLPPESTEEDADMSDKRADELRQLHRETQLALQIILVTGSFEPGIYRKKNPYDDRSWVFAGPL